MATLVLHPETADSRIILLDKPSLLIGSSPEADILLESEVVSASHARIEHQPDGYYIINLAGTPGVSVNGVEVSFQRLKHGDKLVIGDVHAVLLLGHEDEVAHADPAHEAPAQEMMLPASMMSTGLAAIPRGPTHCMRCGMPLVPGMPSCPRCGMPLSNLPAMPMDFIPPLPTAQIGAGILPLIAFLAALTAVGAPVALVLGLMSLSIIRRRGGTPRDRALAKWSVGLGLMWLMVGAVATGGIVRQIQKRKQLNVVEEYEAKAIRALKNLACAAKYAQTIEFLDTDEDGVGEYASLSALTDTQSPFFDTDLADGEAYGYRFTIREASEAQFLAVAEPLRYGETGIRTFVINQDGKVRGADTGGQRFGQVTSVLPVLQGERSAYYEIDDEIAKDVLNYVKSLSFALPEQEKKQRILRRLRTEYALTSVGRELDGMEASVDRFVTEQHAQAIYLDAKAALAEGNQDVALAKLVEIQQNHPAFSQIAAVERELSDLRSMIAQKREQDALALFNQAEEIERDGKRPQEVQELYQRIEKLYPDTDIAARIASLKPELQRQMREHNAENIFSDLMELSPETDFEEILNRANQLRRNYSDTDLFAKVQTELETKERKARASSWRVKTEQNIAAGRMRGALGQLEAAAKENPDLLYDLRDLCIQLYRSVADTLMKEGDARNALAYYEKLSQLLQASGTGEKVDPDMLAKLHNDVGQADYGRKEYQEARWHLASAAWKYADDAQFNMRLGVASLYSGLYQPAETTLTEALNIKPDLTSARLYRAYLNLRVVSSLERVLAGRFTQTEAPEQPETDTPDEPTPQPPANNLKISLDNTSDSGDEITVNTMNAGSATVAAPQKLDLKPSNTGQDWFTRFAESETGAESPVPEPTDLDLFLSFDYSGSSTLSSTIMQFLQDLQLQKLEKVAAKNSASYNAASSSDGKSAARRMGRNEVKLSSRKNIAEFHSQLRQLNAFHLEDINARKELYDKMDEMKQRVRLAMADIQTAGTQQSRIQSQTGNVLTQINEKYGFLSKAEDSISSCMKREVKLREQMLTLAGKMVADLSSPSTTSSFEKDVDRFQAKLLSGNDAAAISQALRELRDSMDVSVNMQDILRAAEGGPAGGGN